MQLTNSEKEKKQEGYTLPESEKDFRKIGLYGEIEEEKAEQALFSLLALYETRNKQVPRDLTEEEIKLVEEAQANGTDLELEIDFHTIVQPIEFILCTPGGSASEMFAIYDVMRMVKEECDIETFGLGKVMSAGVLLLAAGTKGKRKIGKHCRVMIHSVQAGALGNSHDIKNEVKEINYTEDQYVRALARETSMTQKMIREFMDEKVNVYLSSEEAVEYGIADIIV
jgi:ATP-dependent Clp endopeptidase proteolytic subunit ClpP